MIRRREFVVGAGAAIAFPTEGSAQQTAMPVVGFLNTASAEGYAPMMAAFRNGLNEAGYADGQNATVEYHWLEGQYDRLPALVEDLVRRRVTVITVAGNLAILAAKAATTTIPIVFFTASDPVEVGFVASLNRPGGNLTGATVLNAQLGPKELELLHELLPTASVIALLVNPTNPTNAESETRDVQAAARALGLRLHVLKASAERDFEAVFATLVELRADGLVIGGDGFFNNWIELIATLALRNRMPTIGFSRQFAAVGGLMSYGGSINDAWRLVGVYTGRILRGEKPADLPVQQGTKVELYISLKTAKALGITFPLTLLGRADEVIE